MKAKKQTGLKAGFQNLKIFFGKSQTIRGKKIPRMLIVGLVGVSMMYIGVAGMISANAPWSVRGDTGQHVDYVWRLYNGEIPKRTDGIQYPPLVELAGKPKAQYASKNPPLFYAVHAPFVGPLLNSGQWEAGIAVGRAVNIFIGILCILALAWGGWLFGGRNKALHAIAVPALTILIYRFTRLNVDYALDGLLVLIATLSLVFSYKILKTGPTKKNMGILALLSIAGMYTKVAFIVILATNLLAILLANIVHSRKAAKEKTIRAVKITAFVLVGVLVSVGWYYYVYNYQVSGSIYTARAEGATGGRPIKSLLDVMTSSDLWGLFYKNFARSEVFSSLIAGFSLAGVMALIYKNYRRLMKNKILLITAAIVLLAVLGTFLVQIKHATGIGSINFRYMLPVLLPFGIFLSYGLLQHRWARGIPVIIAAIFMGVTSIGAYALKANDYFGNVLLDKPFGGMYAAGAANGVPPAIITLLIAMFVFGCGLFGYAIFKLSADKRN